MREPEREDLVEKGDIWDWIPTLVTFLIIYTVLFVLYKPNLLFSTTTTSGGDTGAYHYPMQYLIQYLLPHFKLTGWAPGWYAGMPMLTFYFPFPFLLIAIFNWFLPYTVAFKIVTVLGVFGLPFAAYAFGRLLRIRRPFPVLAAVFALIMLLMESYSIYGGNIMSTLAGEFSYMLSFALMFVFLGTAYRGMENPKFNMLFVLNCLILMALVLSHIVPTIALVLVAPGLLLVAPRWRSLGYLAAVAAVGFGLSAFWSLPFVADLKWTAHMSWDQLGWKDLLPNALIPVAVLAVIGVAFAFAKREKRLLPLLWMSIVIVIAYKVIPNGRLWNARLVPFWYFSLHLWAAYGLIWMVRPFTVWLHDLFGTSGRTGRRFAVPIFALALGVAVLVLSSTTPNSWIRWNYSGYEGKSTWSQYQQINNFIGTLGSGRVMIEHNQKIDGFGTPRAFEIIPYWTNMQTMEGTLMEASFTAPFHFINQAELSKEASDAIIGIDYPSLNVANGITHLQLMNIEYFLTCTDEVTTATKADPRAQLLATFGDYNIFRISGTTGYAEVMQNQPVKLNVPQAQWTNLVVKWYENMNDLKTPIIWDNGDPALKNITSITAAEADNPPQVPYDGADTGRVVSEKLDNEKFTFDVNQAAIGKPVWIKISYFPNWHVSGAAGPFLGSPSFMVVIPTQTHVVLTYGRTWANTVGQTFEVIGWLILVGLSVWRFILWRRRRRFAGAGVSGAMPVGEFTGQYLVGGGGHAQRPDDAVGPGYGSLPDDDELEDTADAEGMDEAGAAAADVGDAAYADGAEGRSAIARYEAGDQGWAAPADSERSPATSTEPPEQE